MLDYILQPNTCMTALKKYECKMCGVEKVSRQKGKQGRMKRKMAGSDKKLKAEATHIEIIIQSDWCN